MISNGFTGALGSGPWNRTHGVRAVARWGLGLILGLATAASAAALHESTTVVVVFNSKLEASRDVAEYYAARREIPREQVLGLDLPVAEDTSREDYRERLEKPLLQWLQDQDLIAFDYQIIPATRERPGQVIRNLVRSRVRYLVLCYGVPLRILASEDLKEKGLDQIRKEYRRNEAAVDNELAVLAQDRQRRPRYGPLANPVYRTDQAFRIRPANGVFMVARLDGPSPKIAKRLVDDALSAEAEGLWGRAYFDARGITSGRYKLGDDWIIQAAQTAKKLGFETVVDRKPALFAAGYPMSHIAIYAGWYAANPAGDLAEKEVEFVPGAIGYHLHSFSAATVRSAKSHWVGPLLVRGVAATMGSVFEPYLALTPDLSIFFARLFGGFSFGEAAYASLAVLSWQTAVIGDPLYRPFARPLALAQRELAAKRDPNLQWVLLQFINTELAAGQSTRDVVQRMRDNVQVQLSPVLTEKLGDLEAGEAQNSEALSSYRRALELGPSHQQRLRIRLAIARVLEKLDQKREALRNFQRLLQEFPSYPDAAKIHEQMEQLALALGDSSPISHRRGDKAASPSIRRKD